MRRAFDLTLGAELERLRWGVATARQAGSDTLAVGAYINVAVDPDRDRARELVRGSAATFARFSSEAESATPISEPTRYGVAQAVAGYQQERHGEAGAAFAQRLDDDFIDRFAIAGPADEVRDRLAAIRACGIERLIVVPASLDSDAQAVRQSLQRFARDVLPELAARKTGPGRRRRLLRPPITSDQCDSLVAIPITWLRLAVEMKGIVRRRRRHCRWRARAIA